MATRGSTKRKRSGEDSCLNWGIDDVCDFLVEKGFEDLVSIFVSELIDGKCLPLLTEDRLEKIGVQPMGKRLHLYQELCDLCGVPDNDYTFEQPLEEHKIFHDPIHGHMELHPLCIQVIDTPQFQRLRYIKQLGGCYYVFPGAAHNRFEHSLGVCHLAEKLLTSINAKQPELQITERDILCVSLAGLCHDLGHGPFSHMFDGQFIPKIRPGYNWKHEDASIAMFDHLVKANKLQEAFQKYGLTERDMTFIKEMIAGPQENVTYRGRDDSKSFLYEIVANKRNGIDVDKMDYFARDCYYLGISSNFDHSRFMKFARVLEVGDHKEISLRDKEVMNIYDLFHTRAALHRRAYQHKTCKILETMITEAFIKANDHLLFPGKNGKLLRMSEAIDDMEAFTLLTDHVFHQILTSTSPELAEARAILGDVERRRLYKCVGQTKPQEDQDLLKKKKVPTATLR